MIDILKTVILIAAIPVIFQTVILPNVKKNKNQVRFFLFSILITFFLIFIIEIKLHHILRAWINIPNTITYFIYAGFITYYLIKFKNTILTFYPLFMLSSLACFGIAVVFDLLSDGRIIDFTHSDTVENIFHIAGTILWLFYFSLVLLKLKKLRM